MSEQDLSTKPATQSAATEAPTEAKAGPSLALQRKIQRRLAQRKLDSETAGGAQGAAAVHAAAAHGTSGAGGALPHADAIQQSFGKHDVSGVKAHTGSAASEGAAAMGAQAFAMGNDVAFAGTPSLHTAAHEAAHVVQQREGVHLKGGVGEEGDAHEKHADAVADKVVAGESAESLLDARAVGGGGAAVQHKLSPHHLGELPHNLGGLRTALTNYQAGYDAGNPTHNVALLEAVKAAVDAAAKGAYKIYVDDLRPEVMKELSAERQRANKAPAPTASGTPHATPAVSTPTPPVSGDHAHDAHGAEKKPEKPVTAVASVESAPKVELPKPAGPKPAVGDVPGFEQAMGLDALKDARSHTCIDGLMTKVMHTLEARARQLDKTEHEVEAKKATVDALLTEFVGTGAKTVAGAVGTNPAILRATMAHATGGTLREKMTVFFNFASKFQDFILSASDAERAAFLAKAEIGTEAIKARIALLKKEGNATDAEGRFQKTMKRERMVLPPLQDAEGAEHQQGAARAPRGEGEAPAKKNPTVGSLGANRETALSPGELDTMFPTAAKGKDGHVDKEAVKNEAVTWKLGVNAWKEKEGSKFVNDLKALNLPFGAGPSGTTARIFSSAEFLGEPKDHVLRMACIGYLVPIHAHSLLEVVAGAKTHGVAAPAFEELGANIYEHITPFDPGRVKTLKTQFGMEPETAK